MICGTDNKVIFELIECDVRNVWRSFDYRSRSIFSIGNREKLFKYSPSETAADFATVVVAVGIVLVAADAAVAAVIVDFECVFVVVAPLG